MTVGNGYEQIQLPTRLHNTAAALVIHQTQSSPNVTIVLCDRDKKRFNDRPLKTKTGIGFFKD